MVIKHFFYLFTHLCVIYACYSCHSTQVEARRQLMSFSTLLSQYGPQRQNLACDSWHCAPLPLNLEPHNLFIFQGNHIPSLPFQNKCCENLPENCWEYIQISIEDCLDLSCLIRQSLVTCHQSCLHWIIFN